MKKRIFGCLLVVGLALAQVMTVGAFGSKGDQIDITTDGYDHEIGDQDPEIPDDAKQELEGKVPITPEIIIKPTGTPEKLPSTKDPNKDVYRIEFYIPNISKDMLPPFYAYYYLDDGTWHVIESTEIDYENQTVVFEFDELPVGVVIFAEMIDAAATGTSPTTGVASTWMMWIGAAVVLGGTAVMMSKKKRA